MSEDFEARALAPDEAAWDRFARTLERRGRGRIEVEIVLECGGERAGTCTGLYVVVPSDDGDEGAGE